MTLVHLINAATPISHHAGAAVLAAIIQHKHDALITIQWLYILWHTSREVGKPTLKVNIRAAVVYQHLHQNNKND